MRTKSLFWIALVAACSQMPPSSDGSLDPTIGVITDGAGGRVILSPDTVFANTYFQVTISTFGSGSCDQPDRVDAVIDGNSATLTPHDRYAPTGTRCTADLRAKSHPVELTFGSAGAATIHVVGAVFDEQGNRVRGFADRTIVVVPRPQRLPPN